MQVEAAKEEAMSSIDCQVSCNKLVEASATSCNAGDQRQQAVVCPQKDVSSVANYVVLDSISTDFDMAILGIKNAKVIGMAMEGIRNGRLGELSWLQISMDEYTFLFDMVALKGEAFDEGLKDVIEDFRIVKVVHDCRPMSDYLQNRHNIRLSNVFDTQVADFLLFRMRNVDFLPMRVNNLTVCLMMHLGLPPTLFSTRYLKVVRDEIPEIWKRRPASDAVLEAAVFRVCYLAKLRLRLIDLLLKRFTDGCDVYLGLMRDAGDNQIARLETQMHLLPSEFEDLAFFAESSRRRREDLHQREIVLQPRTICNVPIQNGSCATFFNGGSKLYDMVMHGVGITPNRAAFGATTSDNEDEEDLDDEDDLDDESLIRDVDYHMLMQGVNGALDDLCQKDVNEDDPAANDANSDLDVKYDLPAKVTDDFTLQGSNERVWESVVDGKMSRRSDSVTVNDNCHKAQTVVTGCNSSFAILQQEATGTHGKMLGPGLDESRFGKPVKSLKDLIMSLGKPVGYLEKPVRSSQKPVVNFEKPDGSLKKLIRSLEKPVVSLEKPNGSLEKLIRSSEKPVGSLEKLVGCSERPAGLLEKLDGSLEKLVRSSEKPIGILEKPEESMEKLVKSSEKPVVHLENPDGSLEKLVRSSEKPLGSLEKLVRFSERPVGILENPDGSLEKLIRSSEKPVVHMEKPDGCSEEPGGSLEKLVGCSEKPVEILDKPNGSLVKLVRPSEKPVGCLEKPIESLEEMVGCPEKQVESSEPVACVEEMVGHSEKLVGCLEEPVSCSEKPVSVNALIPKTDTNTQKSEDCVFIPVGHEKFTGLRNLPNRERYVPRSHSGRDHFVPHRHKFKRRRNFRGPRSECVDGRHSGDESPDSVSVNCDPNAVDLGDCPPLGEHKSFHAEHCNSFGDGRDAVGRDVDDTENPVCRDFDDSQNPVDEVVGDGENAASEVDVNFGGNQIDRFFLGNCALSDRGVETSLRQGLVISRLPKKFSTDLSGKILTQPTSVQDGYNKGNIGGDGIRRVNLAACGRGKALAKAVELLQMKRA